VLAVVPAGAGGSHHRKGAHALASACHDVPGNLIYKHDVARQARDYHLVDAVQVVRDQAPDLVQWHFGRVRTGIGAMVTA
jgi:hypothetical protein